MRIVEQDPRFWRQGEVGFCRDLFLAGEVSEGLWASMVWGRQQVFLSCAQWVRVKTAGSLVLGQWGEVMVSATEPAWVWGQLVVSSFLHKLTQRRKRGSMNRQAYHMHTAEHDGSRLEFKTEMQL